MMHRPIITLILSGTALAVFLLWPSSHAEQTSNTAQETISSLLLTNSASGSTNTTNESLSPAPKESAVVIPIENFFSRVTKKPFGIYITAATSPVSPERFHGYHSGADAEATTAEAKTNVDVVAVADGQVVYSGSLSGYGGIVIIAHTVNGEKVLALYGHLRLSSLTVKKNDLVTKGDRLAYLGTGYTAETDNERKHLHFAVIKGWTITYNGYVQTQKELDAWHDPVAWLKKHGAN